MTGLAATLAAAVRAAGGPCPVYELETALAAEPATCVVLLDRWSPADAHRLSAHAWTADATCLPIRLDGGLALVGPVLRAGGRTCLGCAEQARLRVFGPTVPTADPELRLGGLMPPAVLPMLAALTVDMLTAPGRYDGVVVALRGDQATVTTHPVRSGPDGCPRCAPVGDDSAEGARFTVAATPTTDLYALRGPNRLTGRENLREVLYDFRHGPVARLRHTERSVLALTTAEIVGDRTVRDAGHGRSLSFADAERVALFEAAERLTGMRPHGRRTVVEASFEELGPDAAIDPVRLGLPDPYFDGHPLSRTTPYTPRTRTRWVFGSSLTNRRAVAVPEHVAYWGVAGNAPRFVYDSSNGCGLGNSPVEAALYGLFEIAERDAFLMAWYARTPLRRVAVPDGDPMLPHVTDRLESVGYDLMLFDATNDLDVPTVLALALHREPGSAAPAAFFAAGAHPDPRAAMRSAVAEVAVDVFSLPDHVRTRPGHLDPRRLRSMLANPELVATVDDHVAMHFLPEARDRYEFLLADQPAADWREVWPGRPAPVDDLGRLLDGYVAGWAGQGLEVVVVDQTDPVLAERLGLHSVKVIAPGTLPMTFGHVNRRVRDLPRLGEVPVGLGRVPATAGRAEPARHPHPFP